MNHRYEYRFWPPPNHSGKTKVTTLTIPRLELYGAYNSIKNLSWVVGMIGYTVTVTVTIL